MVPLSEVADVAVAQDLEVAGVVEAAVRVDEAAVAALAPAAEQRLASRA